MNSFKQLNVLTKRVIRLNLTNPDTLITVIGTPLFMLLFFVYVFGGNIAIDGDQASTAAYLNYSLPGFLLISMSMGSAYTALRINMDKNKGFLDRLHSLPIRRWVILGSHVVASVLFMLLAECIVFLAGVLMGFRPNATTGDFLLFIGISILFAFAITLLAIPFSLKAKDYNGAGGFSYILLMLLFVSSALIPTDGMVLPIRLFAEYQPMTPIVETTRDLLNGAPLSSSTAAQALIWLIGLVLVCGFFAYRRYQQIYTKN
ncbi:ABC transporter permease [Listeria costaricensis]|uniref:ABC transporter permease n=1 Tax=Listeria costaricensis TaxID=2026604 RepID=UPI000C0766E5|nr:ABC transporter permease [Listeria costaricensis]